MTTVRVLALLGWSALVAAGPIAAAATTPAAKEASQPAAAQSASAPLSCAAFMADFGKAIQGHKSSFERPLTITRGFGGDSGDIEVRVLSTGEDVSGTLKCKGDEFRRFELSVKAPVKETLAATMKSFEQAALTAAFHWDKPRTDTVASAMNTDAAEYLKASIERGDTYQAGKVEYHQGQSLDLGVIWTDSDRTFVIASQDED